MFFNTKTIAVLFTLLSFAKKSIALSFHENEAHAKKFEEECGCSIEALTGSTISCTIQNLLEDISISDFATEGSFYQYNKATLNFNSPASVAAGKPKYNDIDEDYNFYFDMIADSSLENGDCMYDFDLLQIGIGCWACPPPTPPPTVFPTSSPSDSPSIGNEEENNDEDEDEEEEEEEEEEEDDNENDDGSSCCCEEKQVESSLLWTIKNALVVGN